MFAAVARERVVIDTVLKNSQDVGGGDSAIEAAIGLATQPNNTVILSYRKGEFTRIKERNRQHIDEFVRKKKITVIFNSEVLKISESRVSMKTSDDEMMIPKDYVFIFAGGELPNEFLKKIEVQMHLQTVE